MEIISGRSIPEIRRKGAKAKYPWLQMKPGDAFCFPSDLSFSSASSMAYNAGTNYGMKFAVRQEPEGIFCYRVDGLENAPRNGNLREELEASPRTPGEATEVATVGIDEADYRHQWAHLERHKDEI